MKRRSIIAAFLASLGGFYNKGNSQGPQVTLESGGTFTLTLQHGPVAASPFLGEGCKVEPSKDGKLSWIDCSGAPKTPEPKYALVVRYGDREVRLTAAEIMDALEGR